MDKRSIIVITFLLLAYKAHAQTSSTASQSVSLNLSPVIQISAITSQNIDLGFNTVIDYANGVESSSQQFKVQSNKDFVVSVNTDASNFSYSGSTTPTPVMPVQNTLFLSLVSNNTGGNVANQFSSYNTLSNTPKELLQDCKRGGDQLFAINYKAAPGNNYPAGIYTIGVVYTATQP